MASLNEKRAFIWEDEERFASDLACAVLQIPKMSFWMILIPIILVYHVLQVRKILKGRKGFAKNFLITRNHALEASLSLVEKGISPDMQMILRDSNLPEKAKGPFKELFFLLVDHYSDLLRSTGQDMPSLIRSVYKSRMNYLLFLNRINKAEKELAVILKPQSADPAADIEAIMKAMESNSERLNRERVERIF